MGYFKTWEEAHTAAQAQANTSGRAVGLEKWSSPLTPGMRFRIFGLPGAKFRQGFELRCEVVEPERVSCE